MDFFQWCRDNPGILGVAAAAISAGVAVVGYAIGAAKWAFSIHQMIQKALDGLDHLAESFNELRNASGKDSGSQWDEIDDHRKVIVDHGERIARVESRVDFHAKQIDQLNERVNDG